MTNNLIDLCVPCFTFHRIANIYFYTKGKTINTLLQYIKNQARKDLS